MEQTKGVRMFDPQQIELITIVAAMAVQLGVVVWMVSRFVTQMQFSIDHLEKTFKASLDGFGRKFDGLETKVEGWAEKVLDVIQRIARLEGREEGKGVTPP